MPVTLLTSVDTGHVHAMDMSASKALKHKIQNKSEKKRKKAMPLTLAWRKSPVAWSSIVLVLCGSE